VSQFMKAMLQQLALVFYFSKSLMMTTQFKF